MQLQKINDIFGISLTSINQPTYDVNIHLDTNIFQNILSKVESRFGSQFLKFEISPDNYMRYKNGHISSMIKNDTGGIQKHVGFETVEMVNLVDYIFMEVDRFYTAQILSQFNNSVNQIFRAIDEYQIQIINQSFYFKEQEQIEELASFKDFFEDIYDELGEISTSSLRATSYITNLVDIRKKNYKIYNFFITKLENWINIILAYDSYRHSFINNPINFQELEKDFYFARQSISTYMICLIYEHVICGNIDIKSKEKIIKKLKNFLSKFYDVEKRIKDSLIQRDNSNQNWNWNFRQDKQYDSDEINWFLTSSNNQEFEIGIVSDIFNKSAKVLENIVLDEEKDNKTLESNS